MNPYEKLGEKHFWSAAVAKLNMFDIKEIWEPKFPIRNGMKISTFGSCFAQHIGEALAYRRFNWFITESPPPFISKETAKEFNYGIFSARTGNIYTATLLKQWVEWATGKKEVPSEIWEKSGRFYDPFRPSIEPNGFESEKELLRSRSAAITAFRAVLTESNIFIFTLGLTESWINSDLHYEYPLCPGTIAGTFDAKKHEFLNQDFQLINSTLESTFLTIKKINPKIKFILTVSPVPLTATMSTNHVLVATMESKSILRAVSGSLKNRFKFIDYFPSYEIINSTPFRGVFFESNLRNVNSFGVNHVMDSFFKCLYSKFPQFTPINDKDLDIHQNNNDLICDEEILNSFLK
jgi:hypothetical protein